jgi:hypothetical protein
MFDNDNSLALEIKNKILDRFIHANTSVFFDKEHNEYFISTRNKELYYSEEYGMLVLEISENLWRQGKFNFYFIFDARSHEFDRATKEISLSPENEILYASWGVNNTSFVFVDEYINTDNFSLAA